MCEGVKWAASDEKDKAGFKIGAALKEFETFPEETKSICLATLTIAAEGGKADVAKPKRGWARVYLRLRCRFEAMRFEWSTRYNLPRKSGWSTRFRRSRRRASRRRNAKST